ncbi:MAG: methenyltetrahydromethanopterin cyclohydrolase [Pirellulales bacterium]
MNLHQGAAEICQQIVLSADRLRVLADFTGGRAQVVDCGVHVPGGLEAGRLMAELCLAGLGRVSFGSPLPELAPCPAVQVMTDHPLLACMASQYAGWEVKGDGYFAMGSGPMRALARREPLFESIEQVESSDIAIGVLESDRLPPDSVCQQTADRCHVSLASLTLLVAPVTSLAGTVQVVARSVETAMHKLFELGFDLSRVVSGYGVAPLPPVSSDTITGIGRTNDAILYGGQVTLYVRGDDDSLRAVGPSIPSSASDDHGLPFAQLFEKNERDFYRIDPHLFSPAQVVLNNIDTGNAFQFGHLVPRLIHESFGIG